MSWMCARSYEVVFRIEGKASSRAGTSAQNKSPFTTEVVKGESVLYTVCRLETEDSATAQEPDILVELRILEFGRKSVAYAKAQAATERKS